jgi:hypothetical protein
MANIWKNGDENNRNLRTEVSKRCADTKKECGSKYRKKNNSILH